MYKIEWYLIVASAVLVLLPLFPLTVYTNLEEPRYGGTMKIAINSCAHLNPAITTSTAIDFVASNLFANLVRYDMDMDIHPWLAESWEISSDAKNYTFHLVRNATWHDGEPFTSADVKFTIEEVLMPYHPSGQILFDGLDRIETPDPYTVMIIYEKPCAVLLQIANIKYLTFLPKHLYEGTDPTTNPHNLEAVGNGPFKLVEFVPGVRVVLERYEGYFMEGLPYLDGLYFYIIPQETARTIALEAGDVDYVPSYFSFIDGKRLMEDPRYTVLFDPSPMSGVIYQVCFNMRRSPFDDRNVRLAIAHAINRTEIWEKAWFATPAIEISTGPWSQAIKWAVPEDVDPIEYDVDEANRLLDEAGLPRGVGGIRFEADFVFENRDYYLKTGEIIRENFKEVGIDLTLRPLDRQTWEDVAYLKWDFDMCITGYGSYPPEIAVSRMLLSSQIRKVLYGNNVGYNNSEVDELFAMASAESNLTKRGEYEKEIFRIVAHDIPMFGICDRIFCTAWRNTFHPGPFPGEGYFTGPDAMRESVQYVWWEGGTVVRPEEMLDRIAMLESEVSELTSKMDAVRTEIGSATTMVYAALTVALLSIVITVATIVMMRKRS